MKMFKNTLDYAMELRAKGVPFVLATVVAYRRPQSAKPGSKAIIHEDGSVSGWVGGGCVQPIVIREAKKVLEQGKSNLIIISPESMHQGWEGIQEYLMTCQGGGSLEIYLEPILPRPTLFVFGHSPVAQVLVHVSKILDYNVTVVDPSATKDTFPDADTILNDFMEVRNRLTPESFIIVATMGDGDEEALSAVAGSKIAHIGFVASREKSAGIFQYLRDKGTSDDEIKQIKCPAGLELGAETLPEIAFSIIAEIIQLRKKQKSTKVIKEKHPVEMPTLQKQADAIDPICGMKVETASAKYSSKYLSKTYYFCGSRCKETFEKTPEQYIK
jgi:xanthine dehydrogenase accessory factor